ncbi:hypothetical protein G3545_08710 [Starkeya sp. ORNL1]|uniref:DUF6572 domain-containing protein n=1 Tax=Starkeya sp. ORNL1 TaxID=2709380 RepID=UPI001462DE1D|nr:DUF6572 domain-containing protein [Starkeya sp. ORNL1]QJP13731.1 hypothetical protein G3545_08710 [Starkeya sp. ORNL1]
MSLDNLEVIDAVGTDARNGTIFLAIIDAWDWSDEWIHLNALQDKLNLYFEFVESGRIYEEYPAANGRYLRIDVLCKYPIPDIGLAFLERASKVAAQLNMTVTHRLC